MEISIGTLSAKELATRSVNAHNLGVLSALRSQKIERVEVVDSKGVASYIFVDKEKQRLEREKSERNVSLINEWLDGKITDAELKDGIEV